MQVCQIALSILVTLLRNIRTPQKVKICAKTAVKLGKGILESRKWSKVEKVSVCDYLLNFEHHPNYQKLADEGYFAGPAWQDLTYSGCIVSKVGSPESLYLRVLPLQKTEYHYFIDSHPVTPDVLKDFLPRDKRKEMAVIFFAYHVESLVWVEIDNTRYVVNG